MEIKSFEDLECWKLATEIRSKISILTKTFPKEERYSLTDQLIRSSRSVTNNIAEGYGRFHFQENIQFNRHSRGSLHEVIDHLIIARDEGYISEEDYKNFRELLNKNLAILNGYINYLVNQKKKYASND
jgi:four helix bundle protein